MTLRRPLKKAVDDPNPSVNFKSILKIPKSTIVFIKHVSSSVTPICLHGRYLAPFLLLLSTLLLNLVLWIRFGDNYHTVVLIFSLIVISPVVLVLLDTRRRCIPDVPSFIAVVIAVVVGLNLGFFALSSTSVWCCLRHNDRRSLCDESLKVIDVLENLGIDVIVSWGSLIGALRQNSLYSVSETLLSSNDTNSTSSVRMRRSSSAEMPDSLGLIPWEHDIDLSIHMDHLDKAMAILKRKGFNVGNRLEV